MNESQKFIPPHPLNTAVLFLVFNRLDTTRQVFDAIKTARPPRIYIASDGPRESRNNETIKVQEVREHILNNIDWDCEVKTLFRKKNLGCKRAVSSAIEWFFDNEESGIILEDDCLPSQSFFWFCETLLEKYKDDMRVWHIGGNNFGYKTREPVDSDYSFIRFSQVWGWATWRSRWKNYDADKKDLAAFNDKSWASTSLNISTRETSALFKRIYDSNDDIIDTWDYQWHGTVVKNHGLCITPMHNLISNIGDGADATHTQNDTERTHLDIFELRLPLSNPESFFINFQLEEHVKKNMHIIIKTHSIITKGFSRIGRYIRKKLT